MASHFSSLGIEVKDREDFTRLFSLAYDKGEKIKTNIGTYIKWEMGNGFELWGQIDKKDNAIGINPYFSGTSVIRVRIENAIERRDDTELDGAIYCWSNPQEGEEDGEYPFVFDLPNFALYQGISFPQIVNLQVTAIAHEISVYKNDEEFEKSQEGELKFASESFIPVGLFREDKESGVEPESTAIFTGHVVEAKRIKNLYFGKEIQWAKVKTLGGEFDVIIDPEILNGEIVIGGVISGMFWLAGKIVDQYSINEKSKKKFSLHNLFKK